MTIGFLRVAPGEWVEPAGPTGTWHLADCFNGIQGLNLAAEAPSWSDLGDVYPELAPNNSYGVSAIRIAPTTSTPATLGARVLPGPLAVDPNLPIGALIWQRGTPYDVWRFDLDGTLTPLASLGVPDGWELQEVASYDGLHVVAVAVGPEPAPPPDDPSYDHRESHTPGQSWQSTDGGQTWHASDQITNLVTANGGTVIPLCRGGDESWYVIGGHQDGTYNHDDITGIDDWENDTPYVERVWRSTDGLSWTSVTPPVTNWPEPYQLGPFQTPHTTTYAWWQIGPTVSGFCVFGQYHAFDDGAEIELPPGQMRVGWGIANRTASVHWLVGSPGNIWPSVWTTYRDNGGWTPVEITAEKPLPVFFYTNLAVYAARDDEQLARSDDGGLSWTLIEGPMVDMPNRIVVLPSADGS
jgi:hypothetical protein